MTEPQNTRNALDKLHRLSTDPVNWVDVDFDKLFSALRHLADTVNDMYPSNFMTCTEADALADVLLTAGFRYHAVAVLVCHLQDDAPPVEDGADSYENTHSPAVPMRYDDQVSWVVNHLGLQAAWVLDSPDDE